MFGLAKNTLKEWEDLEKENDSLENRTLIRKPFKIDRDELRKYCEEHPFAINKEVANHFCCTEGGIRQAKKKSGITRKKKLSTTGKEMKKKDLRLLNCWLICQKTRLCIIAMRADSSKSTAVPMVMDPAANGLWVQFLANARSG